MNTVAIYQEPKVIRKINLEIPINMKEIRNQDLNRILTDLFPPQPWGERKIAAEKLGRLRNPAALPELLKALPVDPFWMVRCAIIQALEKIGNPDAIPVLREVALQDGFQVVRAYAAKAIERLANKENPQYQVI